MSFEYGVGDFLTVLKLANTVRKQFIDVPGQLQAICSDVKQLSNVLRDIEDNDPGETLDIQQQKTLNESRRAAQDGPRPGLRKAGRRVWNRLTWDQSEIVSFRRRIVTNIKAFGLFLTDCNRQLSRETKDIVAVTQHGFNLLVQYQDDQQRRKILNWLSPVTHEVKQANFYSRVQPGTGSRLLESDVFRKWIALDEKTPVNQRTLFCPGIPGAGKTFLTSIVINRLQESVIQGKVTLAFFYCNFREKTTLLEILSILLRQVIQQHAAIPRTLETIYQKHLHIGTSLTVEECLAILDSALAGFPKTSIVLNALDECFSQPGSDENCSAGDIERFLKGQLENLPKFVQQREVLPQEVISAIAASIDGMFLLARLHLDSIKGKRSAKQIREGLKTLPTGLDAAYEDAWSRIGSQLPDEVQTAKEELQHALAIEDGQSFLDEDNIPEIGDLIAVCGGLVIVDQQEPVVRLVHYTTQEYFERHQARILPHAHRDIASKCIHYLSFDTFESGTLWTFEAYDARLREYPLFEYVAEEWGYHVQQQAGDMNMDLILKLLRKLGNVSACFQVILGRGKTWYSEQNWERLCREFQTGAHGVHLAACSGLIEACRDLISQDENGNVDPKTDHGQTPLWFAAAYGFPDLVQDLLNQGAYIETRDNLWGRTPLYSAVRKGHEEVYEVLVNAGADLEARTKHNGCPLGIAAEFGNEKILKLLLARGANANITIQHDATPLQQAQWADTRLYSNYWSRL
ncbi:hypothetical protein BDW75DRAFT_243028 [Aspergillus navahoensis]